MDIDRLTQMVYQRLECCNLEQWNRVALVAVLCPPVPLAQITSQGRETRHFPGFFGTPYKVPIWISQHRLKNFKNCLQSVVNTFGTFQASIDLSKLWRSDTVTDGARSKHRAPSEPVSYHQRPSGSPSRCGGGIFDTSGARKGHCTKSNSNGAKSSS